MADGHLTTVKSRRMALLLGAAFVAATASQRVLALPPALPAEETQPGDVLFLLDGTDAAGASGLEEQFEVVSQVRCRAAS